MKIYSKHEISASHVLDLPYESKCRNLHGHNYIIEIWIEGEPDKDGMLLDFSIIKHHIKAYDHKNLNDIMADNPTAENIAREMRDYLYTKTGTNIHTITVRVWEDSTSYAEA